ncbi:hypothetical protein [Streptomyces sp. NBC_01022]|uniref:hypothetical protein n=1 Tax=Streptomyces sp. NBC_01022 TaxID=2903723 RepID=UPI002DDABD66|nr:hypothetical protein [Streptomyces sp. NBC_01022]WRZ78774.1 hypothetical protein OG316_00065 [Streptomyces sp. NBC_01022]WRZ86905.1 hypothetical protein OG316_44830 [Streptomyces sp. NBC_01022]
MLGPGTPPDPDAYQAEIPQILEAGRLFGAAYTCHGEWGKVHSGLVILAGQIAARTLHQMIAQEHGGPHGFEDLDTLIDHACPQPGHEPEPAHSDPVITVGRMLRTHYDAALPRLQHRTIRTIASLRDNSSGSDKDLLLNARLSARPQAPEHHRPRTLADHQRAVPTEETFGLNRHGQRG